MTVADGKTRKTTLELVVLIVAVLTALGFVIDAIPSVKYDMPAALYGVLGTGIGALAAVNAKGKAGA